MRHRPKTSDHLRMPTALARGLLSRLDPISRLTTGLWTLYWRDRNLNTTATTLWTPAHKSKTCLTISTTEPTPSSGDTDRLTSSNRCTDRLTARRITRVKTSCQRRRTDMTDIVEQR